MELRFVARRVIDEATLSVATPALPADEPAPVATPLLSGTVLANDFMQWLAGGIAAQTLAVNAPGASVHFVADGPAQTVRLQSARRIAKRTLPTTIGLAPCNPATALHSA